MLPQETLLFIQQEIGSSMDSSCLKEFRKQLSWLMQNHKAQEAVINIREHTLRNLRPHEKVMSDDCLEDIRAGSSPEELFDPILELLQEDPQLHWLYLDLFLRVLSEDHEGGRECHRDANRVIQYTHDRLKEITIPERALKRAQESLAKSLGNQTRLLRSGYIDLRQTQRDLQDALHHPNSLILNRALKLIREWKRRIISGQKVLHHKNRRPVGYRLDEDTPVLLAEKLLNHQPSCEDISVALSTLARTENGRDTALQLTELLRNKLNTAKTRALGTSLWALAKLDIGKIHAPFIAQAIVNIIHDLDQEDLPNRVTTVSSLWSMAALDVPAEYAQGLLDYAEGCDDLDASEITRCFHVAVYFDHQVSHWRKLYEQDRPNTDTWYARKFRNNGEIRTYELVQSFLKKFDIAGKMEMNGHCFGLECDVLVELDNGSVIDVEFDGPVHRYKTGSDHFRDRVLRRLGVEVIRLNHTKIPYHESNGSLSGKLEVLFGPIRLLSEGHKGLKTHLIE